MQLEPSSRLHTSLIVCVAFVTFLQLLHRDVLYRIPFPVFLCNSSIPFSPQRLPCKRRQHKAGLVNLLIVVSAKLLLLLSIPAPHRRRDVSILVFAAYHETYLARRIGGDSGVGVFDNGEDFPAGFFQVCYEGKMEPLVFR